MEKLTLSVKKMIQDEIEIVKQIEQTECTIPEEQRNSATKEIGEEQQNQPPAEQHRVTTTQITGEPWTEVVRRRHGPNLQTINGTKHTTETKTTIASELQAANRRAWLYIGHLHQNTMQEKVERHLKKLRLDCRNDVEF